MLTKIIQKPQTKSRDLATIDRESKSDLFSSSVTVSDDDSEDSEVGEESASGEDEDFDPVRTKKKKKTMPVLTKISKPPAISARRPTGCNWIKLD